MIWYDINKQKPIAVETGCFDGKRSDKILVCTIRRKYYVVRMYHAIIDNVERFDFYDEQDNEVDDVKYWTEISEPF